MIEASEDGHEVREALTLVESVIAPVSRNEADELALSFLQSVGRVWLAWIRTGILTRALIVQWQI
jgi:hypothetical protein